MNRCCSVSMRRFATHNEATSAHEVPMSKGADSTLGIGASWTMLIPYKRPVAVYQSIDSLSPVYFFIVMAHREGIDVRGCEPLRTQQLIGDAEKFFEHARRLVTGTPPTIDAFVRKRSPDPFRAQSLLHRQQVFKYNKSDSIRAIHFTHD